MDPESPSDIRRRPVLLRTGGEVPTGGYADLDQFQISTLLVYRTIVMRTGPVASRPPYPYRLIYNGTYYQVWQRPETLLSRPIVDSIPLGGSLNPIAVPELHPGGPPGPGGRPERGARRRPAARRRAGRTSRPPQGGPEHPDLQRRQPRRLDVLARRLGQRSSDDHGRRAAIGSTHEVLNEPGGFIPLGKIRLGAGVASLLVNYSSGGLAPGSAGPSIADPPSASGRSWPRPRPGTSP